MPDMQYNTDDLRTGASRASTASDSASSASSTLQGAQVSSSPFGRVNGAEDFAGAVGVAQQHHAVGTSTASKNMTAASERASGTAGLGDDNESETTRLAPRMENAKSVSTAM